MESEGKVLVGKVITKVEVEKGREAIRFTLAEGEPIIAYTVGDCCSYTWLEGVEMVALPAKVLDVEDIEMPAVEPHRGQNGPDGTDCVQFYGLKITTDQGHMVVDYRNDSNGYYGGELKWPGAWGYEDESVKDPEWLEQKYD